MDNNNIFKHPDPIDIKNCEILILDIQMVVKKKMISVQHWWTPTRTSQIVVILS